MNFYKSALVLSTFLTLSAQAEWVAIVIPPEGLYTESESDAALDVTQDVVTGTYSVTNAELIYSDLLISDEGCDVELDGDESSGTWTYYNNLACSDDDNFTLIATKGLSNTVTIFRNSSCDYLANEWLTAAHDGTGTGLLYSENSCSINNSIIRSLMSFDNVPAYYLDSIYIDIFSTGEGEENLEGEPLEPTLPDEGEGEGSANPEFNLPYIQWVYDDIVIDHPFLTSIDLSNLTYVLGDSVILRGMGNITSFDLSSLRNYYSAPLNVNVMGAMNATELDISRLSYADTIDISYTNISDISKFYRLQTGTIITNNDSETFFPQVTTFPNRNSSFCYGVRARNITLSSSISQANAENACR
ncbi:MULTISPECIES: hypothetical protein [unclassified Vibrio]|uniref:hypothetical protein n=1 Tax=unclassified Vibrio TaxID=2614977 RepID=UPI000C853C7C|nr:MULTISPECIES: hypothetical protein [unclassified Vibrio]PMK74875.1 hypothetical protein BCT92_23810 [Vibrio sp. 10N.261.52.E5]TKF75932.1 hypothetical protein FCV65_24810 [Vibrio sp. F13]